MVKVGTVYKSEGRVDLTKLPLRVKMSVFLSHMIDSSYILSGNRRNLDALKDEEERQRIYEYTLAFEYYLRLSKFRFQQVVPFVFDIDDEDIVRIALSNPTFFEYSKEFVALEPNLVELKAYKSHAVIVRRLANA